MTVNVFNSCTLLYVKHGKDSPDAGVVGQEEGEAAAAWKKKVLSSRVL